jgi:2,3-bisphosphoglycerate-independent phosphoglycerate mutase
MVSEQPTAAAAEARPFDFSRPYSISRNFEKNLRSVCDNLAKAATVHFTNQLRTNCILEFRQLVLQTFGEYAANLPNGKAQDVLTRIMNDASHLLEKHDINKVRVDLKENPANMIWLWGQGTNPNMPSFKGMFGVDGAVISAVDLVNGIGKLIGLEVIQVPGATGYYDTNYKGKGEYAVNSLKKKDFIFVHVEAPDEAGHNGDMRAKITAIENFDRYVVGAVWKFLKPSEDYRIMVLSDHATPVALRTHVSDPAPFIIAGKGVAHNGFPVYNESNAKLGKVIYKSGAELTGDLIKKQRL